MESGNLTDRLLFQACTDGKVRRAKRKERGKNNKWMNRRRGHEKGVTRIFTKPS
jgi:hypothetical protein